MKIWFDISNSPHVNMWHEIIQDLEKMGHEIVITSRPLANTIQILDQKGLTHTVVGEHYGKNIFKKLLGFPIRVFQLWKYLKSKHIDLAVSQSSFHSPLVAFLLRVPSIYTNDNEHALGNIPAFLFASCIMIPESMNKSLLLRLLSFKTITYPGIKEGIYLWRSAEYITMTRFQRNSSEFRVFVRPEPSTAQYYDGKENFLDDLLIAMDKKYPVTVLTRNTNQFTHYSNGHFGSVFVPDKPIPFDEVASGCTFFIGAGGSMTREMAMIGIPTISVYQDKLLEVDKLLVEMGLMIHQPDFTMDKLNKILISFNKSNGNNILMQKGKFAYEKILRQITHYNNVNL